MSVMNDMEDELYLVTAQRDSWKAAWKEATDREVQLKAELLDMCRQRDDWAMKYINMRKQYAEVHWPGLDKEVKAI